jgi:hypothetical protein
VKTDDGNDDDVTIDDDDVTFVARPASVVEELVLDEVESAAVDAKVAEVVDSVNVDRLEK